MVCSRCGADAPDDARFCPSCGAPMEAATLQEERKLVSILFVDVVGSTARADGADPEDVRDQNREYYGETRARIEAAGGVVEKYVGDAVMAVFGAPLARSDDAERAVHAALSVLEGIEALNARHAGLDLHVRAAVGTGEALVTMDAAPADALATGDIVNTAARLQSAAPVDGVVVDEETMQLTRHAFRFEELPPVEAKGKRDPVHAWQVVASAVPAGRPMSATPFVGRDHELRLAETLWRRVCETGTPHVIVVLGPAGIGKTRLGREVSEVVEGGGGRAVWGRSLPYQEQTPYRAFDEMIRRAAGIFENDPADVAHAKLATLVETYVAEVEADEVCVHLSQLLGIVTGEGTDDPIRLFFAARRLLEQMASRQPLLLVFEDLHWADDGLMDLLDYLVKHVADAPLGFLVLTRPEFMEERPGFGAGPSGLTRLPLAPLIADEAAQIVASLLASDSAAAQRLVERAEGNPLFLEELAAAVADDAQVEELPTTVRAAIAARIDALPPDARNGLMHASVIGQSFWRGVVEQLGGLNDVDGALDALEARGLIQRHAESQVTGDVEYAFRHMLIRDVAYATLPRAVRRDLHAATARLIESSVASPDELAWVLAVHWREAGDAARAVEYLVAAGDRASAALATEQTFDLYGRAIELATSDEERRRIRLRRGLALADLEDFPRADAELGALIPELDGLDEIEAMVARAKATFWTTQTETTITLATEAADRARALDADELEAVALSRLSAAYVMRGEPGDLAQGIELGERVLRSWIPGARPVYFAEHLFSQADNYYWAGQFERCLEMGNAALELGGHDPSSMEYALRGAGMRGLALSAMGRYEEAFAAAEAAIEAAHRTGRGDAVVTNYSTLILRDLFLLEEAADRSSAVAARLGPSAFIMPWMNARADALTADVLRGDIGAVERAWPVAWEDASASRAWERWLVGGRLAAVRAESDLVAGRLDDAVRWAERTLEIARPVGRRKYEIEGTMLLGRALAAQGDTGDAIDHLRLAISLSSGAGGSPLLAWRARAAFAEVAGTNANTGDEAEARLQEAGQMIREIAGGLAEERATRYLAAPQVVAVLERAG